MDNYGLINAVELPVAASKLQGSEIKMLLLVLYYLSASNKPYLINDKKWREFMVSMKYAITPERTSMLLSSLTKKGLLKRETKGVYSVIGNLYKPTKEVNVEPETWRAIKELREKNS